jgi:hypothetical protein
MRLLSRLASPAGFVLAALFFLFPFVAVSCDAPQLGGSIEISYTGVDLATGGDPTVETIGGFGREPGDPVADEEDPPYPGVQALALVTLLLTVAGLVLSVLPAARIRLYGAVAASLLGGVLLVVTQSVAHGNLVSSIVASARDGDQDALNLTEGIADEIVQTRIGFWLTLAVLVLLLGFNVAIAVRERLRQ